VPLPCHRNQMLIKVHMRSASGPSVSRTFAKSADLMLTHHNFADTDDSCDGSGLSSGRGLSGAWPRGHATALDQS